MSFSSPSRLWNPPPSSMQKKWYLYPYSVAQRGQNCSSRIQNTFRGDQSRSEIFCQFHRKNRAGSQGDRKKCEGRAECVIQVVQCSDWWGGGIDIHPGNQNGTDEARPPQKHPLKPQPRNFIKILIKKCVKIIPNSSRIEVLSQLEGMQLPADVMRVISDIYVE